MAGPEVQGDCQQHSKAWQNKVPLWPPLAVGDIKLSEVGQQPESLINLEELAQAHQSCSESASSPIFLFEAGTSPERPQPSLVVVRRLQRHTAAPGTVQSQENCFQDSSQDSRARSFSLKTTYLNQIHEKR
jgi:hypothetical protein